MFKNLPLQSEVKQTKENVPEESKVFIIKDKIKQKKMKWKRKMKVIFHLEVTANPPRSQGQSNSTCLCRPDGEAQRLARTGSVQE